MDSTVLKSNLDVEKGKLKQKFAILTDDDSLFEEGIKDEIKAKYNISISSTENDLNTIISSYNYNDEIYIITNKKGIILK